MTPFQRSILALLGVALAVGIWMFRFEIVTGSRVPYLLDRWTGNVRMVIPDSAF